MNVAGYIGGSGIRLNNAAKPERFLIIYMFSRLTKNITH
jgi:hypothetical protein